MSVRAGRKKYCSDQKNPIFFRDVLSFSKQRARVGPMPFAVAYGISPASYYAAPIIFCRTGFVPLRLQVTESEIRMILNGQSPDNALHSCLKTIIGSTFVARRAGI